MIDALNEIIYAKKFFLVLNMKILHRDCKSLPKPMVLRTVHVLPAVIYVKMILSHILNVTKCILFY